MEYCVAGISESMKQRSMNATSAMSRAQYEVTQLLQVVAEDGGGGSVSMPAGARGTEAAARGRPVRGAGRSLSQPSSGRGGGVRRRQDVSSAEDADVEEVPPTQEDIAAMLIDDDDSDDDDLCHYNKTKRIRGPETGEEWVLRTLADPPECYKMFRVTPDLFYQLHDVLVGSYGLKSSTKSSSIEALGMFLWILGSESVRNAANRFGRSLDTVNRNFEKVLKCVVKLAVENIKPLDPEFRTIHPRLNQPRFSPYFNKCVGAIDGTHIPVVVPNDKMAQYMCRKKYTSQNVLAVCDFYMRFTFVLASWPGSVHDMRVFKDATTRYSAVFPHPPPGMFYLVDFSYPNKPGYLAPYKGTKYHLREFRNGPMPRGMKETFNFLHSSLRNVVERAFEVLKEKSKILKLVPSFPLKKQSRIIVACMALHNFIRDSAMDDQDFAKYDQDEEFVGEEDDVKREMTVDEGTQNESIVVKDLNMNAFRDQLANALFQRSR